MKAAMKALFQNKRKKAIFLSVILLISVLGVGLTLALVTDVTNVLANTFKIGELTTHIEENVGSNGLKQPVIINDGPATAFIRARITVSPDYWDNTDENISLKFGTWDGISPIRKDVDSDKDVYEWPKAGGFAADSTLERNNGTYNDWYCTGDGWYYYTKPVAVGTATTQLFDAVIVGSNVTENFDITIYQEAVAVPENTAPDTEYSTENIINAFKE